MRGARADVSKELERPLLACCAFCTATALPNGLESERVMNQTFDFVIVGAGSAGCVLANRLSRDPSVRVLLLEAGGWDKDPMIGLPVGIKPMTAKKQYRWVDTSDPDEGLNGRINEVLHGKVIGGGSSINYMAHTRGHPRDYERWVTAGADGWGFEDVAPFFKECEAWERGESATRGGVGEIGAQQGRLDDPVFAAWFDALRALGYDRTDDYNASHPEGFGAVQYSIRNGRRSSAAREFLHPALQRPNLTVQVESMATKILFDKTRAVGVEYVTKGQKQAARAGRVVLSLGAINTPHLLMLSGIGPAAHLRSMGISPLMNLPVGQGLEDHLGVEVMWERKKPGTFHQTLRLDQAVFSMFRGLALRSGPASRLPGVILGFAKSNSTLPQPDLQYYLQTPPPYADVWFPGLKRPYQDTLSVKMNLLSQQSRGEILLRSTDPTERPRIVYNSLSEPRDIETLREGVMRAQAMLESAELSPFRGNPLMPDRPFRNNAEVDAYIRSHAFQQYHPACTCKMGKDETDSVLNPDLSVRGIYGLNVADASVMPNLISANPNIPVVMLAAKAAAMWLG